MLEMMTQGDWGTGARSSGLTGPHRNRTSPSGSQAAAVGPAAPSNNAQVNVSITVSNFMRCPPSFASRHGYRSVGTRA